jgi:hypothetical protein
MSTSNKRIHIVELKLHEMERVYLSLIRNNALPKGYGYG